MIDDWSIQNLRPQQNLTKTSQYASFHFWPVFALNKCFNNNFLVTIDFTVTFWQDTHWQKYPWAKPSKPDMPQKEQKNQRTWPAASCHLIIYKKSTAKSNKYNARVMLHKVNRNAFSLPVTNTVQSDLIWPDLTLLDN